MKIVNTTINGLYEIESNRIADARGSFERLYCVDELSNILNGESIQQINHSVSHSVGTLRGLHFQHPPFGEIKFVNCIRGTVYDVVLDLRKDSDTFLKHYCVELTPNRKRGLLIPKGCAHGFQVLEADSEIIYFHTTKYAPHSEGGVRYDDPLVSINWPLDVTIISDKDKGYPLLGIDYRGLEV